MQNPLVLIFTFIAIFWIARRSVEATLIDVFLPVLIFISPNVILSIPHVPPASSAAATLLPLGLAAIFSRSGNWRFKRADIWVVSFVLASGYTDFINNGISDALYNLPSTLITVLFSYIVGKLLIEQRGLREQFARRMVVLIGAIGIVSAIEFLRRWNLFVMFESRIFTLLANSGGYQARGSFLRVSGPFAGAEQAGIVFMMAFFLSLWLWYLDRSRRLGSHSKYPRAWRSILWVCGNLGGLYMTLSRGPLLGTVAGALIAQIGLAKNKRRAIILALILGIVGGIVAHNKIQQYSHVNAANATEKEMSADYRTHLYDMYKPVAEQGGLFGWSATSYPRYPGYGSIDNQYLLMWVTNGKVGLGLFILIAAEAILGFALAIRRSRQPIDTCFYYCMEGAMVGLTVILATVWLVGQGFVFLFLFVGWSQSLRDQSETPSEIADKSDARFAFRRVLA